MVLKCNTSWTTNSLSTISNQLSRESIPTDKARASPTCQWNLNDPNFLPETLRATPNAVTIMGPPQQYFGESIADRYAFMMYEATSLLNRYGFRTSIPLYHPSETSNRKYHQRVPGILGYLLNDIDSNSQIAVFDQNNVLVAYMSFMTYTQPWLKAGCVTLESPHTVNTLHQILSKSFFLADLFHESKTTSIVMDSTASGSNESNSNNSKANITVKMTTGVATRAFETQGRPKKEDTLTKFVFATDDGSVLCRAIWSYASERLGTVGPALEEFDVLTTTSNRYDLGLILSAMEDAMTDIFAPLVAFRIRISCSHPSVLKWISHQGYTENKQDGFGWCKAFAMF